MTYSLMSDHEIAALGEQMIDPFVPHQVRACGTISYGLSSFGYDARLAPEFRWYRNRDNGVKGFIDPKLITVETEDRHVDAFYIEPNGFVLGRTVERFRMPNDVMALCVGKSTYARCGLIVNVTPLEPGWEGHVTLEISNTTPFPAKVYANEGICQFVFFRGHQPSVTYADRSGKYQNQVGIVGPRV